MKSLYWKLAIIVATILVSVVHVLPSIYPNLWPYKKINLGLDLKGGMHVVLDVNTNKATENILEQMAGEMRSTARKIQLDLLSVDVSERRSIEVIVKNKTSIKTFEEMVKKNFSELSIVELISEGGPFIKANLEFSNTKIMEIQKNTVAQALETIRNRIDQFGVNEPDIRLHGDNQILIQLPGVEDTQRAKELIGKTALLEFRIVTETENLGKLSKGLAPPGTVVMYKNVSPKSDGSENRFKIPIAVKNKAAINGAYLTDARVRIGSRDNSPYVMVKFNKTGAKIFEKITSDNLNRRLAIILDNVVHSTPTITETIAGGEAVITGKFKMNEARDLAIVLRAGSLPAPVKMIEERTVGPSLGSDSIRMGLFSMFIGAIIVTIFMVVYYKVAGIIANLALLLNALMVAAGLAMFQASLTLPGIAGIILTLGMAVDSNVLVFERIREEISLGRPFGASVSAGYSRATLTILDANVTTLVAALVLFQFGTGPIKGFAVTLSLGILASLFTSLTLTRTIFDYLLSHRKINKVSI